jgi:two-component SAPR family response regulator
MARHHPALRGIRVLIVEDEAILALDLADRLKREGCDVIGPVSRETKALAVLELDRPDAVVLDLNLNGKVPIDLAHTMVARHIPFVIVTGYGTRPSDDPALLAAPRLQKPVNMADLVRSLSDIIRRAA